jgi:hypothetical protein
MVYTSQINVREARLSLVMAAAGYPILKKINSVFDSLFHIFGATIARYLFLMSWNSSINSPSTMNLGKLFT